MLFPQEEGEEGRGEHLFEHAPAGYTGVSFSTKVQTLVQDESLMLMWNTDFPFYLPKYSF